MHAVICRCTGHWATTGMHKNPPSPALEKGEPHLTKQGPKGTLKTLVYIQARAATHQLVACLGILVLVRKDREPCKHCEGSVLLTHVVCARAERLLATYGALACAAQAYSSGRILVQQGARVAFRTCSPELTRARHDRSRLHGCRWIGAAGGEGLHVERGTRHVWQGFGVCCGFGNCALPAGYGPTVKARGGLWMKCS